MQTPLLVINSCYAVVTVESGRVSSLSLAERIARQITTRTPTTQTNCFVAALWAFTILELLKVRTKKNHYALKTHLYLSPLQQAFNTLCHLDPVRLEEPAV